VQSALRVLTRPDVLIVGRASGASGREELRYRAAASGGLGVLAGEEGERVVFEVCAAEELIEALLRELPEVGPVPLEPVSVTEDSALLMRTYLSWPIERFGIFELSVRGPDGRLAELGAVQFFDSPAGRFMVTSTLLPDGSKQRTYAPADRATIASWLRDRGDLTDTEEAQHLALS
jgi:hypothetical protein